METDTRSTTPWIVNRLRFHAARRPGATAVVDPTGDTTDFATLWARAGDTAAALGHAGVEQGDVVAVMAERGSPFVVAALGAWRAGAAYLPLDPTNPTLRLRSVIGDARPPAVVTSSNLAGTGSEIGVPEVALPLAGHSPRQVSDDAGAGPPEQDPAAYVIYTSGTTGRPKGVVVGHTSLANLTRWHAAAYAVGPRTRALHTAGLGFDATVWELWPTLAAGATVVVCSDEERTVPHLLGRRLAAANCHIAFVATPLAEALLDIGLDAPDLRHLLTGGDELRMSGPPPTGLQLVNHYGPTEATVVTTAHPVVQGVAGTKPPIGRPIDGLQVALCDAAGHEVSPGATGEIHVGGDGLAHGYLHNPALTAQRFLALPGRAGRWYRTGDRARLVDGELMFEGRVGGDQLKVRGVRVEASDIEAALLAVPGVRGAAVAVDGRGAEGVLVAVLMTHGDAPTGHDLRRQLGERLPAHLIPSRFVAADALPLTPNGKLDRPAVGALAGTTALDRGRSDADLAVDPPTEL